MRRLAIVTGMFLFATVFALAQGNGQTQGNGTGNYNGPMWRLDGNAGTDIAKPHFLGTVDLMGLAFRTNDQEHMRITAAGDVGIGISIPQAKLHVVGDAIIDGLLDLAGDLNVGGNLTVDGTTLLKSTLDVLGNTGLGSDLSVGGNTSLSGTLDVTGNSTLSNASLSGNLGVGGNTSLTGTLDVTGNSTLSNASLSGNLGVGGNSTLTGTLDVTGNSSFSNASMSGNLNVSGTTTTSAFRLPTGAVNGHILSSDGSGNASWIPQQTLSFNNVSYALSISQGNTVDLSVLDDGWENAGSDIYFTGDVAIGSSTFASGYELSVDGEIACEEVLVDVSSSWPDYVFNADYNLMSLGELRDYIATHNHLPNIPSAVEVEENGLELGEMQRIMVEKIEELTLYIIQQQKTIDELKSEVDELKEQTK